jgi:hypothetical protein
MGVEVQWECVDEFHYDLVTVLFDWFRDRKSVVVQYLA